MCRRCVVTRVRSRQAHQRIIQTIWQDMKWTALLCPLDCCTPVFIHMLPDTHTHTAHQCNSAQAGLNNSSGHDYASTPFLSTWFRRSAQQTNTHTHKLANAPWPTCAMESFVCSDAIANVSSPRLPSRPHLTTVSN
jgi:hypothetical protein